MKLISLCCFALALVPGCLLVQPLDDVEAGGSGGATAHAGSNGAGHSASGGASAGSGATHPSAGASGKGNTGGTSGAPSGVDFSLFLGTWTITSGKLMTDCGTGNPTTTSLTPGTFDTVTLGTTSDLLFDAGTVCPFEADVDDRTATALPGQTCSGTDPKSGNPYDLYWDSFTFVVAGNGTTAQGTGDLTTVVTNGGTDYTCVQHEDILYTHTL